MGFTSFTSPISSTASSFILPASTSAARASQPSFAPRVLLIAGMLSFRRSNARPEGRESTIAALPPAHTPEAGTRDAPGPPNPMTTRPLALDVHLREARERAAFAAVAAEGRAARSDADLILPPRVFARMLGARSGTGDPLEQMFAWARPLEGARVLEICCFDGENGVVLARGGAEVTSVDLCDPLVRVARRRAQVNGVADRMTAVAMSAHDLRFPDESFDVVFGKASLHHLDLELARREILRVLRPSGIGLFAEPVRLSPWLGALRDRIPVPPDCDSPDERQLDAADLARFTAPFAAQERAYFRLLGRLARVAPLEDALKRADRSLLDRFPALDRYAGICVLRVHKAGAAR